MYKSTDNENIDWSTTLKKKAKGIANYDLGEVQEIKQDHVVTRKGKVGIDEFFLPKDLLEKYDGDCLLFNIEKKDAQIFMRGV